MGKTFKLIATILLELVEIQKKDNNFDQKLYRRAVIKCLEDIVFKAMEFPENDIKNSTVSSATPQTSLK